MRMEALVREIVSLLFTIIAFFVARRVSRSTMTGFAGVCVTVAIASITWNMIKPAAFPLSDLLLLISAPSVILQLIRGRARARLPVACAVGALMVGLAVLLNAVLPVAQSYSESRYLGDQDITSRAKPFTETLRVLTSIENGVKMEVGLLILPLALMAIAPDRKRLLSLIDLWAVSALINAFVGVIDATHLLHISIYLLGPLGEGGGRQPGLTNHPNHLATVCVIALPIVLTWWRRGPNWRRATIGSVLLLGFALDATGSRGGIAVGGGVIGLAVLTQPAVRKAIQPWILPGICAIGALLLIDTHLLHTLLHHTRFSSATGTGSDRQRAEVARQAILDIKHRPLIGVGFDVAGEGHSIYLQAIASGGVLTLIGMIIYISSVVRTTNYHRDEMWQTLVIALSTSLLGWLLLGIIENDFADRYPYVSVAMLLAIAAIRADEKAASARRAPPTLIRAPDALPQPRPALTLSGASVRRVRTPGVVPPRIAPT